MLAEFDLGGWGRLSGGPVASGRLGSIWRLDTDTGSWAVKEAHRVAADERAEVLDGAAFQEAARAAGVPVPPIRRAIDGALFAPIGDTTST